MRICNIVEWPGAVELAARWIWQEWSPESGLTLAQTRERLMDTRDRPAPLLAVVDETAAGVLGFGRFVRSEGAPPSLFIDALFVAPHARARGIGSALVEEAIARARPFDRLLHVYTTLPQWYEARGFTLIESLPDNRAVLTHEL